MNFVELQEVVEVNPRLQKRQLRPDEPVSFVPMAAVSEESKRIVSPELRPYSDVAYVFSFFEEGDVLIAKITPCFENGKIALAIGLPRPIAFGSTEFHVFRAGNQLVSSFLFHLLQLPAVRKAGAAQMQGAAGQKRVSAEFFKGLKIPLPSIEEQKRIAAILDAADALRVKRRESVAQLDALLQSTFLDMFGDPVTNPMGWECMPFNKIGRFLSGSTPSKERTDYWGGLIPWVSPKDMKVTRINDAIDHVTDLAFEETNLKVVEPRCVLIVVRGMILAHSFPVAVNQVPVAINQDMKAIVPLTKVNVLFLLECISLLKRQILSEVSTAGHGTKRLDSEAMKKILVPLPPLSLQRRFASIVEAAERQKARLRAHLDELDALFSSLQSRAFNGEL